MRSVKYRRWLAASAAAILAIAGGGTSAFAATATAPAPHLHARDVTQPSDVDPTINPTEFTTTDNPVTLDPPVSVPKTRPVVVTLADNQVPTVNTTVTLPKGKWAKVVLDVSGSLSGRNYDRLFDVFDGSTQIFLGCTPEPTTAGITFHVQKDITNYLPILTGTRTFSVQAYAWGGNATVKVLFYPAGDGFAAAHPASLADPSLGGDVFNTTGPSSPTDDEGVPTDIVPIVPTGDSTDWNSAGPGQTLSDTVTLPDNIKTASLDIYAVGQIGDEPWWALEPGFREIEISIDGQPAGVVEPYPVVFTGEPNPQMWRPLTAIHTLDIPAYRVDLTPFAGLLSGSGTHTISFFVVNDNSSASMSGGGWWDVGGSLLLTTGGSPVSGSVTTDSLSFPASSTVQSQNELGDSEDPTYSEMATHDYTITGTIKQGGHTYTDTLAQNVQYFNDESWEGGLAIVPVCTPADCYEFDEQVTTSSATDAITGPGVHVQRSDKFNYTISGPNGWLQTDGGSDFDIPANVSQQLTDIAAQNGYTTNLSETIEGYGNLQENNSVHVLQNGITTGTITWNENGRIYNRTVATRGGQIVQDITGS